jgi:uncharacterized protein (DUF983 family)
LIVEYKSFPEWNLILHCSWVGQVIEISNSPSWKCICVAAAASIVGIGVCAIGEYIYIYIQMDISIWIEIAIDMIDFILNHFLCLTWIVKRSQ